MHIENGIIDPLRIVAANTAALGLIATQLKGLIQVPVNIVKAIAAALIFSVLMQSWHLSVGPSELHLIGATTIYLLLGFRPTMVGFALGLMLQTIIEPQDIVHIGVNSLSLMIPLIGVHMSFGKRLFGAETADRFTFARVLRLDAIYYGGVASMVAFWLMISNTPFPATAWAQWAVAYMPVFVLEAMLTFGAVTLFGRGRENSLVQTYSNIGQLNLAR